MRLEKVGGSLFTCMDVSLNAYLKQECYLFHGLN